MRKRPLILALLPTLGLLFVLGSCSSEQKTNSAEIKPGTPAFFWASAKNAQARGDFAQAAESLGHLTTGPANEYRERAEVWLMTLSAGLARGDMEWIDALRDGAKLAREKQGDYRKAINEASADANQNLMRYAEVAHAAMVRGLPADVAVSFTMPALDAKLIDAEPGKMAKGMIPPPAELAVMRAQWRRRGAMRAIARTSGNGEDLEKARAALANGDLKLKADDWRLNIARDFIAAADFYSPKKLDHAARAKVMIDEAKVALAALPAATAQSKDMQKQLDALSKKLLKPTS